MKKRLKGVRGTRWSSHMRTVVLVIGLVVIALKPAWSQNVCSEAGLPSPLWGICNAYCDTFDCDSQSNPGSNQWLCGFLGSFWNAYSGGQTIPCADPSQTADYERIHIAGETTVNGVYDLAIEYDDTGIGWMVYTAVIFQRYLYTHLAKTTDRGETWTYISRLNDSLDDTVMDDDRSVPGVWKNEVPTLLHDPTDPDLNRRWKMFWHKYFTRDPRTSESDRMFDYGWIAYKYADTPENLAYAEEMRLFGASPYPRDPASGANGYGVRHYLNELDPALSPFVFFSEPGSLVHEGVIYLSFDAGTTISGMHEWEARKTILIASDDHGNTWRYVGVLTDYDDSMQFDYVVFTGTALAHDRGNGTPFLLAAPAGSTTKPGDTGHDGTYIFEFADIRQARLKRNLWGELVVNKYLPRAPGADSGGLSDANPQNINGGVIMGNIVTGGGDDVFQIFNTGYNIGD